MKHTPSLQTKNWPVSPKTCVGGPSVISSGGIVTARLTAGHGTNGGRDPRVVSLHRAFRAPWSLQTSSTVLASLADCARTQESEPCVIAATAAPTLGYLALLAIK